MTIVLKTFVTTLGLFISHWTSVQIYSYVCAPPGIKGLLQSFVLSPSPICIAINYIQFYTIELYYTLWLGMSISFFKLVIDNVNKLSNNLKN